MQEAFRRNVIVANDPEMVWGKLLDVDSIASWVSIVEGVREVEQLRRYAAVLQDRMGPFKLRANLDIEVLEVEEGSRVRVHAEGQDRQVKSRISVDAELTVFKAPAAGSTVGVEGKYEVTGRVATLGAGSIRKKASLILDEFFDHLVEELGGSI